MKQNYLIRSFILFLLVINFKVAYAQTSGPHAPEYTSFEPVDVTDMVNLATGDFTYSVPLLEIPGPEGGYPLSLSYHAGIQPLQEASWVGLGWTLNAGAITRTVNGYADDQLGATRIVKDYNEGGEQHVGSLGIGFPGVGFGLQVAHDTYKGVGIGYYVSSSLISVGGEGSNVGGSVGITIGTAPYGQSYAKLNAGFGVSSSVSESMNLVSSVGLSTNFSSTSYGAGVGMGYEWGETNSTFPILGVSMSSNSTKPSMSAVGFSMNQTNNNADNWSVNSWGFNVPIPTPWGFVINVGYNYTRYWLDQEENLNVYGALYAENAYLQEGEVNTSLDSYALADPDVEYSQTTNVNHQKGGSFLSPDHYSVNAQGISGTIRPYSYRNISLFRQTIDGELTFETRKPHLGKVGFRFVNDFSNRSEFDENMLFNKSSDQFELDQIDAGGEYHNGYESNLLAGSKDVQFFTNIDIRNGIAAQEGLIPYQDFTNHQVEYLGMNIANQIGGYKITNSNGMTYHFSLPVYNYGEYFRAQKIDDPNGQYHERRESQPYAYQWLLTAITGPDYVDRGEPGLDASDWGYWVGFGYHKYVNDFQWRNPSTGYNNDIDGETNMFSYGKKEIYYLDSVYTRTHIAKLQLSERNDGREVARLYSGGFQTGNGIPTNAMECELGCSDIHGNDFTAFRACVDQCLEYDAESFLGRPLLKLDKINLFKLEDNGKELKSEESLRSIDFNYDYSLQPNTLNSFNTSSGEKVMSGKLTLKSLQFLGKKEVAKMPPLAFEYELPQNGINVTIYNDSSLLDQNNKLKSGDLITFTSQSGTAVRDFYGVLSSIGTDLFKIQYLNSNAFTPNEFLESGTLKTVYKTKNPPFDNKAFDYWNMFKSDFGGDNKYENDKNFKFTSEISSKNKDVYSLRKINSPIGANINIEYESDSFKSVLSKVDFMNIKNVSITSGGLVSVEIFDNGKKLNNAFETGKEYDLDLVGSYALYSSRAVDSESPYDIEDIRDFVYDCGVSSAGYEVKQFKLKQLNAVSIDESTRTILFDPNESVDLLKSEFYWFDWPVRFKKDEINYCDKESLGIERVKFQTDKKFPDYIVGGLIYSKPKIHNGGNIRVKQLEISEDNGNTYSTIYDYKKGVSSYEPFEINYQVNPEYTEVAIPKYSKKKLVQFTTNSFADIYAINREIIPPGVQYGLVSLKEEVNGIEIPGKIEYEFQTFDSTMVQRISPSSQGSVKTRNCTLPPQEEVEDYCAGVGETLPDGEYVACGITCVEALNQAQYGQSVDIVVEEDIEYPMVLKNYSVQVGNLKAMRVYGKDDQLLSSQENVYLHDVFERGEEFDSALEEYFANQGKISQAFHEFRTFKNDNGNMQDIFSFSQKIEYPNVMLGQRVTDHKRNIVSEQWNLAFDWFSGEVLKTISKDSYGSYFLNESKPAYHVGEYEDSLGLAMYGGKNMLTQLAATDVFKVGVDNDTLPLLSENIEKLGLLSASRNIWSDQIPVLNEGVQEGIYRKKSTFSWNGQAELQADGTYPIDDFEAYPFDYAVAENNGQWEKQNEVTLIDVYSHILEQKDLNEQFSVAKKDPGQCKTTLSAANANYHEVTFSGAEYFEGNDFEENGVNRNQGNVSTSRAHTGEYSLLIPIGNEGFSYTMNANDADFIKDYRASVWVYLPGDAESAAEMDRVSLYAEADGQIIAANSPVLQRQKSKSWYLLNLDIEIPEGTQELRIGTFNDAIRAVYMDDFRVHPINAPIVSYVYDPFSNELTHILGKDNLYARFEYDAQGRLVRTFKEFFYPVDRTASEMVYNYAK